MNAANITGNKMTAETEQQVDPQIMADCQCLHETDVLVTRQPIFDVRQHTVAYQVLFRCGQTSSKQADEQTLASAQIINSALNLLGLSDLIDNHRVFIRATTELLTTDLHELLPPGQAVLELEQNITPDEDGLTKCREIQDAGYEIAVHPLPLIEAGLTELVSRADYLVIDFQKSARQASSVVESRGPNARVLARAIESHDAFVQAKALGCEQFQGFFFAKPHVVRRRNLASGKRSYLRFLHEVNRPDLNYDELEQVIKQDTALTCKLLRYLNSALFGLSTKLSSIKQALTLLGERPLRRWASLLAMTHLALDKPPALLHTSLARARFCEMLSGDINMAGRELDLFLMGLLSTLDAMLDVEMHEIVPDLPLAPDVKAALLSDLTNLGKLCALAIAHERAQWTTINTLTRELNLGITRVLDVQNESLRWADEVMQM